MSSGTMDAPRAVLPVSTPWSAPSRVVAGGSAASDTTISEESGAQFYTGDEAAGYDSWGSATYSDSVGRSSVSSSVSMPSVLRAPLPVRSEKIAGRLTSLRVRRARHYRSRGWLTTSADVAQMLLGLLAALAGFGHYYTYQLSLGGRDFVTSSNAWNSVFGSIAVAAALLAALTLALAPTVPIVRTPLQYRLVVLAAFAIAWAATVLAHGQIPRASDPSFYALAQPTTGFGHSYWLAGIAVSLGVVLAVAQLSQYRRR